MSLFLRTARNLVANATLSYELQVGMDQIVLGLVNQSSSSISASVRGFCFGGAGGAELQVPGSIVGLRALY
jgi:hypothetical protein